MNAGTCWEQEYNRPKWPQCWKSSKKRPLPFLPCSIFNHSSTTDVLSRPTEYPQLHPTTHCVNLWPVWSKESCRVPTNKYCTNMRDCFSYSDCNNILLHSTQLSTTAQAQHQTTQGYCLWINKPDIDIDSWFQAFAVFCMFYAFFWVIPWRLKFICRRFGTPCLFHLHRQIDVSRITSHIYLPMKMEQSVPKRRHMNFRRRGVTQKKA